MSGRRKEKGGEKRKVGKKKWGDRKEERKNVKKRMRDGERKE